MGSEKSPLTKLAVSEKLLGAERGDISVMEASTDRREDQSWWWGFWGLSSRCRAKKGEVVDPAADQIDILHPLKRSNQ